MKNNIILIGDGVNQSLTESLSKALVKDNTIKPTLIIVGSILNILKTQYSDEKISSETMRDKMYKYYTSYLSKFKEGVDSVIFINTPHEERNYIVNNRNIYRSTGVDKTNVVNNEYYVFTERIQSSQSRNKNNQLVPVRIKDKLIIQNNTENYFIVTYNQLFGNNPNHSKIGILTYTPYFKVINPNSYKDEPVNITTSLFLANYLKTGMYTDVCADVTVSNLINILKINNEK